MLREFRPEGTWGLILMGGKFHRNEGAGLREHRDYLNM